MALVVGKVESTGAAVGGAGDGKIFGFSIKDIKDMMEIWRDIMRMRQSIVGADPPAQLPPPPPRELVIEHTPRPAAPVSSNASAIPSKADKLLDDIHTALSFVVKNNCGDIKLFDALEQSGLTVSQIYDMLNKALNK